MAQEISVTVTAGITVSSQTVSGTSTYKDDLTGEYIGEEQSVGTTAALIDVGTITTPAILYVRNLDATNYIEVDSISTMANFPQKLFPGEAVLLKPETGTVYAKAHTAPCQIFFICG
jgi:hypothetical protein